jgi:zinc-ribbon domain
MLCRNCGTEIADKAIVCYRCGTATTDPVRKPAEIRRRRGAVVPVLILIVLALLALFFGYQYHVFSVYSVYSVYSVAVLINFPAIHA